MNNKRYLKVDVLHVRICRNREKKEKYCKENNLCIFCCDKDHKIADCKVRRGWLKNKEARNHGT